MNKNNFRKQIREKRKIAANRLREARINAGYPSANHASISMGWSVKNYSQHEEGKKAFDNETAKKYAKAFKVGSEHLHPYADNSDV